ncbi:MAG TPA: enoyl-CoA hydratase/isomerase family protein, partial [Nakamurella sp.]
MTPSRIGTPIGTAIDSELLGRGHVVLRVDGPVATVSLDRPAARNAQLRETWAALAHLGETLGDDIRVVVVCGEGPSFSAGLDLSAFGSAPDSLLGTVARA